MVDERVKDLEMVVLYLARSGYAPSDPSVAAALRRMREGIAGEESARLLPSVATPRAPPLPVPPVPSAAALSTEVAAFTSKMFEANAQLRQAQQRLESLRENGNEESIAEAEKAVEAAQAAVDECTAELDERLV